jgi:hypothetical protein
MLMWQRTHLWTAVPPLPAPARDVLAMPKSIGLPLSQIWKGGRGLIHCGKEAFNADVALDPPVDSRPSPPSTS